MDSLLAHLYSRIKGAPEDIATESLCYILNNSLSARKKFIEYLYDNNKPSEDLYFQTQIVGENNERPDLIGMDANRDEVLIVEAKFWAYLTDNQPVEYLKRLQGSNYKGPKVLTFICPDQRVSSLWSELKKRCDIKGYDGEKIMKFDCNVKLNISSWQSIINIIKNELISEKSQFLSDLEQLEGLCIKIDEEAFLPIQDKELGIDIAKRIYGYYGLLAKITDRLKDKLGAEKNGLQSAGFYGGYRNYMKIGKWTVNLQFNLKYWIEKAETPLWIGIKDEWKFNPVIQERAKFIKQINQKNIFVNKNGETIFPLFLPTGVDESTVIDNVVDFIEDVFEALNS